jgi:2-hydroxy-3-oxopropionate reductase
VKRIGVVGVGLLGGAVASRLLAAGFDVTGYDVESQRVSALEPQGLRRAGVIADAIRGADLVFTVLPTPAVVDQVWRGPGGLFESASPETVLCQMSTIDPGLARSLGETAAARGLSMLDTPVSGMSTMVARGECTIFVGGDAAVAERCQPVFSAIARKTAYVGPAGAAAVAKLAANLVGGVNVIALAEALVLGAKSGLAPAVLFEALRGTPVLSPGLEIRGKLMVEHQFPAQIRLDLFMKDFKLMLEEGAHSGAPLPLTSVAHQLCVATSAAGRGAEDLSAVITALERLASLA